MTTPGMNWAEWCGRLSALAEMLLDEALDEWDRAWVRGELARYNALVAEEAAASDSLRGCMSATDEHDPNAALSGSRPGTRAVE